MRRIATATASGLLFGLGLAVSGMTNPAKVLGFLDISGSWDPSLALVMAAAVTITAAGYRLACGRPQPLFAAEYAVPPATRIDAKLLLGAAIFGIGWGLAGYCPGPALAALGFGAWQATLFTAAMVAGMLLVAMPRRGWPQRLTNNKIAQANCQEAD